MKKFLLVFIALMSYSLILFGQNVIFVENSNGTGSGSLRQVIQDSNIGDTIKFLPGISYVHLDSNELVIDKSLSIVGDSNILIKRNGSLQFRIIKVGGDDFVRLFMKNITINNGIIPMGYDEKRGGGIFTENTNSELVLHNCLISNNISASGYINTSYHGGNGGGIYAKNIELVNCRIAYNHCGYGLSNPTNPNLPYGNGGTGGGLCCDSAIIINCSFFGNSAGGGGGGYWGGGNGGSGGGIYIGSYGRIINSTICFNFPGDAGLGPYGYGEPGNGGGVCQFGNDEIYLENCIISNNTLYDEPKDLYGIYYANYNLVYDTSNCNLYGVNNLAGVLPGFINAPSDLSLSANSPAINAGNPDTTGLLLPETDLLNNPRIIGDTIDLGAYEYQLIVGIGNYSNSSIIEIFPNPVNSAIFFEFDFNQNKYIYCVYSTNGAVVKEGVLSSNQNHSINVNSLKEGMYVLQIIAEDRVYLSKFIKK